MGSERHQSEEFALVLNLSGTDYCGPSSHGYWGSEDDKCTSLVYGSVYICMGLSIWHQENAAILDWV
jgi:hypothetical protein